MSQNSSILFTIIFSLFLLAIGIRLIKLKSLHYSLKQFEAQPKAGGWFYNWFLWWRLPIQRRFTYWSINHLGDRFVTSFYRLTGLFFITLAIAFTAGLIFLNTPASSSNPISPINQVSQPLNPSPTPFPFQDMTIPYLRNRHYQSNLGELNQAIEGADYTAYLTNYDSDGLNINGLLYIPKGPEPVEGWPAVVFLHGYIPPQTYRTLENYHSYASYLAENGLVVFKIDLRGHDRSEGEAGGAYYSGDYIIDTLNAYAALQNADFVDPNRIGLWGHSMAGNVVFRSLAVKPDIPKVVIWAGAVYTYEDWQQYRINDNSYRPPGMDSQRAIKRQELFDTHGEFNLNHWFWEQVPGTNYLDGIKGAIQIHHAINDPVVSIDYSRNLISILDTTNISHKLFEYSSGGHNLEGSAFNTAMSRTADFFSQ